jgi:hypothetical protein
MSDSPPRLAKLFSSVYCARYVSFGWSVKHEFREAPGAEPYEYILEWGRAGDPIRPDRWGENWVGLAQGGPQADALCAELQREVGPGHTLFGRQLRPICALRGVRRSHLLGGHGRTLRNCAAHVERKDRAGSVAQYAPAVDGHCDRGGCVEP